MNEELIVGIDEAGRGPLAGPVVAAAVILDPAQPIHGLADSKILSALQREKLSDLIQKMALAYAIGYADVKEIDEINILQATLLAMQRAVNNLSVKPHRAMVDGSQAPRLICPVETIVKGDSLIPAISAASILAKVTRDAIMVRLDKQYPEYGFAQHKGYGTKLHLEMLKKLGITPEHRQSFKPVRMSIRIIKQEVFLGK